MHTAAIGGYFELELATGTGEYHTAALRLQSARAALLALLQQGQPSAVWLPWYLCHSMLEPLQACGIRVHRYGLDAQLRPTALPELGPREWLLYVNYFGLCDGNIEQLLAHYPASQLILDHSQAFYAAARPCLANLYSPRKFFGVPDGGYLYSTLALTPPAEQDQGSLARCQHLLQRLAGAPEPGYASYLASEASLSGQPPRRMSALTERLLNSLDYPAIGARRRANYHYLARQLDGRNQLALDCAAAAVPLCYPLLLAPGQAARLRASLLAQRIYTPVYWPELAAQDGLPAGEMRLVQDCLFLPCDQRLDQAELDRMLMAVA
jgi:hypothetical protein